MNPIGGGEDRAERSLRELAAARRLPFIGDFRAIEPGPGKRCDERVFRLVELFAAEYGDALVLYGGITATERIYGLKRIRDITTDLDFACAPGRVGALLERRGMLYHEGYDILCASVEGLPVAFAYGHIHDWPIAPGFFAAARTIALAGASALCCSREHSIMLKMRRMAQGLREGSQPFGKDALDIINILAAASLRPERGRVDLPALAALVRSDAGADIGTLASIMRFISGYSSHLTEAERPSLASALGDLAEALDVPFPRLG